MKLKLILPRLWAWLNPQTWPKVYTVIATMLIGFLAAVYFTDWLKGALAR